jgi:hypothetical protein
VPQADAQTQWLTVYRQGILKGVLDDGFGHSSPVLFSIIASLRDF